MTAETLHTGPLQRGLKNRHIQLIALGGAIGTGLFLGSAGVLKSAGPSMILGYAIGGFIAWWAGVLLFDGLSIKAAGASMPQSINYLPLSMGGALMVVFALNRLVLSLRPATAEGGR